MFDVYPSEWPIAVAATDPRNQFHERALHEARMATDVRQVEAPVRARPSFVTRLRHAVGGGAAPASTQPCNCPA